MSLEHYSDYTAWMTKDVVPSSPILSNAQKQINVNEIKNIDEQKSSDHVTEQKFDHRFNKWLAQLAQTAGKFSSLFKGIREEYNSFAKIDKNDDAAISPSEFNAGKPLITQSFEEDIKKDFVREEQDNVKAELNDIDEQKYIALDQASEIYSSQEILPYQSDLLQELWVDQSAVRDPFAYAQQQIADKRNREHGIA